MLAFEYSTDLSRTAADTHPVLWCRSVSTWFFALIAGSRTRLHSFHFPYVWRLPLHERVDRLPRLLRSDAVEDAHELGHDPARYRLHDLGIHVVSIDVALTCPTPRLLRTS